MQLTPREADKLKVLGPDGPSVAAVLMAAAAAAHREILGSPPPASRRP